MLVEGSIVSQIYPKLTSLEEKRIREREPKAIPKNIFDTYKYIYDLNEFFVRSKDLVSITKSDLNKVRRSQLSKLVNRNGVLVEQRI